MLDNLLRKFIFIPKCKVCGKPAGMDNLCDECRPLMERCKVNWQGNLWEKNIDNVDFVYALYYYRDRARKAVIRAKFNNPASFLASFPGEASIDIRNILEQNKIDRIMSSPYHRSKLYDSEFDLPREMAKRISKELKAPLIKPVEKIKNTARQHDLPLRERRINLSGAFKVTESLEEKNILIIDDVITTGITISTVASRLKKAGRNVVCRWAYTLNELDK